MVHQLKLCSPCLDMEDFMPESYKACLWLWGTLHTATVQGFSRCRAQFGEIGQILLRPAPVVKNAVLFKQGKVTNWHWMCKLNSLHLGFCFKVESLIPIIFGGRFGYLYSFNKLDGLTSMNWMSNDALLPITIPTAHFQHYSNVRCCVMEESSTAFIVSAF